jgi:hypothetical protein
VVVQDAVIHPNVQEDDCIDQVIYHRINTLYEIHNTSTSSRNMSSTKHTVYSHDLFDSFEGDEVDTDYLCDINADIDILAVNVNKQTMKPSPRLEIEQWKDLSVEARQIWSPLPDRDNAIIIHGQQGSTKAHLQPSSYKNRPARNANNHIIDDVDN